MSQIPITREYAEAVGEWCQQVESRSLLHEKLAFPKQWGGDNKENQASNWSLMRIASNGSILLSQKAVELERKANGRNVETDEKRQRLCRDAEQCRMLARTKTGAGLEPIRPKHSARFLELLSASYSTENLRIVEARLEARLAINLAEGVIQNAGINLDRIFGLPLINGSSVKGVARSVALAELKEKNDDATLITFVRVFGAGESDWKGDLAKFAQMDKKQSLGNTRLKLPLDLKGAVTFLQATPTNDAKIVVDITNVHTPDYYGYERLLEKIREENDPQKKQRLQERAADSLKQNEHPNPNYFPAVERGAEFAFPILLNGMSQDQELLKAAERWLVAALENQGVGAKTAAGYGWFSYDEVENEARRARLVAERERDEEDRAFRDAIPLLPSLDEIEPENLQAAITTVEAFLDRWNGREGLQPIRDRLARNRVRLPRQDPVTRIRMRWSTMNERGIINGEIAEFERKNNEEKSAIVEILREPGNPIWQQLRVGQRGRVAAAVEAIRRYCRDMLNLGRMP